MFIHIILKEQGQLYINYLYFCLKSAATVDSRICIVVHPYVHLSEKKITITQD